MLEIQNLSKSFGKRQVLDGLSLSVPEHSIFGFIGRNGAGKTTTMRAILGLIRIDGGSIQVAGKRVTYGQTATNKYIGYLPDVPEFYNFMSPREYLMLCARVSGLDEKTGRASAERLLELVGLSEENGHIKGFSRGMKQRLGIAQALLGKPRLLICDEPTSALDPIGRKEILDILKAATSDTTVLFSTHILSDVERICTDAAFINHGKVVLQGKMEDIRRRHSAKCVTVETVQEQDASRLLERFSDARRLDKCRLEFAEDEQLIASLYHFIADEKIGIERLERAEADLERVFMEVSGK